MTFANAAFLFFGIIAGVLAFIGLLDAVKGTPVKRVVDFRGAGLPSVRDDAFQTSMELASRTEMCEGNRAEYFWNGDQTYPRLWADLRSAKESITFQMYRCQQPNVSESQLAPGGLMAAEHVAAQFADGLPVKNAEALSVAVRKSDILHDLCRSHGWRG